MGCHMSSPHTLVEVPGKPVSMPVLPHAPSNLTGSNLPAARIEQYYDVYWTSILGKGHYGKVYKARQKATGRLVAVKVLERTKSRKERLRLEVEILRRVGKHPNVVELLGVFETPTSVQLVFELMAGELFERLVNQGPFTEEQGSKTARKLTNVLQHLHTNNICHRDVKPENLLLTTREPNAEVKLCDFGLACIINPERQNMKTVCGQTYTYKVDLWSLGVIIYVLLSAYHPFDPEGEATEEQLQENIKSGRFDYNDPVWDSVSNSAKDLINHLLVLDPNKRYDTYNVLAHPWIQKYAPPSSSPSDRSASPPTSSTGANLEGVSKARTGRLPVRGAFENSSGKGTAQGHTGPAEYVEPAVKRIESKKSNVSLVINTAGGDSTLPNRIITSLGSSNQRSISTRGGAGTRFSSSQLSPMPQISPDPTFPSSPNKPAVAEMSGGSRARTLSSRDMVRSDRPQKSPETNESGAYANQFSRDPPRTAKYVAAPAGDEFSGSAVTTAQNTRASVEDDVVSESSSSHSRRSTPKSRTTSTRHAAMGSAVRTETKSFSSSPGRDEHPRMFAEDALPRTSSTHGRDSMPTADYGGIGPKRLSMDRSHKLQRTAGTAFPEADAVDKAYEVADPVTDNE